MMGNIESQQAIPRPETKINKRVGAAIRLVRTERRVTQKRLASLLGISPQQVHKLESGASLVSAARLILILEYLGITPIQFATRLRKARTCRAELFSPNAYSSLADGLVSDFLSIKSDEAKSQIRGLIRTMIQGSAAPEAQHDERKPVAKIQAE